MRKCVCLPLLLHGTSLLSLDSIIVVVSQLAAVWCWVDNRFARMLAHITIKSIVYSYTIEFTTVTVPYTYLVPGIRLDRLIDRFSITAVYHVYISRVSKKDACWFRVWWKKDHHQSINNTCSIYLRHHRRSSIHVMSNWNTGTCPTHIVGKGKTKIPGIIIVPVLLFPIFSPTTTVTVLPSVLLVWYARTYYVSTFYRGLCIYRSTAVTAEKNSILISNDEKSGPDLSVCCLRVLLRFSVFLWCWGCWARLLKVETPSRDIEYYSTHKQYE